MTTAVVENGILLTQEEELIICNDVICKFFEAYRSLECRADAFLDYMVATKYLVLW
jgi:hypothetical protein